MNKELESLTVELKRHDNLYYDMNSPEISDAEYDALKRRFIELNGGEYDYVPGNAISEPFERVMHTFQIKSLDKIHTEDEVRETVRRLAPVAIQPKLDGLTVVVYPDAKAVSRGNGTFGDNYSHTYRMIPGAAYCHSKYPVRVEVLMDIVSFAAINRKREKLGLEPYENARNAAAGMLRNKDANKVEGLMYLAYNLVGSKQTETEQLEELNNLGFATIPYKEFANTEEDIEAAVRFCMEFDRDALPYEIDGLVIKSNIPDALGVFGETGHHPKSAAALKFEAEGGWTKIIDVIDQVGRTGKIAPVGVIEPIEIMGSTITRVTLHNYGIIEALKISKGCDGYVIKANDVIPAVIETRNFNPLAAFKAPKICPECRSKLVLENSQHFCYNDACPAKLLYNICHIAKRDLLDIEDLSEATVKKMIDAGFVTSIYGIFDLDKATIQRLPGFADKSATNIYNAIQKARNVSLAQFICSACIPTVGRSMSRDIAKALGTYEDLLEDIMHGCQTISQIDGVGQVAVENITKYATSLIELRKHIDPIPVQQVKKEAPANVLTIVITGTLSQPRASFEKKITDAGHKLSGSVSKKTSYLVAGENPGGSKFDKATDLGIKIIGETELEGLL